ncbi:hypothetical protein MTO96_012144 [Rhipicephalus appendiculatus]
MGGSHGVCSDLVLQLLRPLPRFSPKLSAVFLTTQKSCLADKHDGVCEIESCFVGVRRKTSTKDISPRSANGFFVRDTPAVVTYSWCV